MLNLVSNDVNRFDQLFVYLNYLWVGPLQIIITTIVLYYKIGMASLVGLLVLFILAPLFRMLILNNVDKTGQNHCNGKNQMIFSVK